ncbi:MAG: alpha/beta fold hydrolase [Acidobacteriota bacterium]
MRRTVLTLLCLAFTYWGFSAMLDSWIRQMLYPAPPVAVPSPPPSPLLEVWLDSAAGDRIHGWFRPVAAGRPATGSVLFLHGNGENLETLRRSALLDQLADLGVSVLAIDYPGYGASGGRPSQDGLVSAAQAGLDWLVDRGEERRFVVGWSLGAAVAMQLAADRDGHLEGVVLISPWDDLKSLAAVHFPGFLVDVALKDAYDSRAAAAGLRPPALVIHGTRDTIIPVDHGRRLHHALPETARFVPVEGAGHNDVMAYPEVWRELGAFLGPRVESPGRL